ncbi:MAG: prepilin peptidase [Candidatus Nomurabacteria bacterium]|nr:prepilin peptidase [Candidatus Nomurabacteria bacterium]
MYILIFAFIFLIGTIIGSFLNVVIYRFNTGMTLVNGRSICMTCNRNLRWFELIPVLSFLIQSGKCRRCESKISHQYPIVEFLTGVVFTLVAYKFMPILYFSSQMYFSLVLLYMFMFSVLIVISVYDLRHKIIPDKLVIIFIISAFLSMFINSSPFGPLFIIPSYAALVSGPMLALPFALLWLFSKGRLMGLGDGKLVLGIGWMLGLSSGIFMAVLSFWIGTIVSVALIFLSKNKINMKSEIPFAPFLIVSALIVFIFNLDVFSLIRLFSI